MTLNRGVLGVLFSVILVGLSWFAIATVMPPQPVASDAPATEFSAERAYEHVKVISEKPHPTGSTAASEVREYIVEQLRDLGLDPQVQESVGASGNLGAFAMANVQNVVVTIKGTDSSGTLYLMTHYDSVTWSHGANDDGVGVSTLLETARAISAGPQPRNDVVLLFTDAEEACLCGAEAYVNDNPEAGGVVLNFEARGSSGPAIMFETSRGNAGVVGVYANGAPYPVATSFAVEVYRILPNDTDFSPFRAAGRFTGLNTAYIDGSAAYHSQQDSIENFSLATLQHHGSNAIATAQGFAAADLAALGQPSAADATYFPILGTLLVYPGALVWVVAGAALVSVVVAMLIAIRRKQTSLGKVMIGTLLGLVPLALPAVLAMGFWKFLVALRPAYASFVDPWQPGWFRAAIVALVIAVVVGWFALCRRKIGSEALSLGALFWLAALGIVLAVVTPGGSYLAAIPALAGGLAAIVRVSTDSELLGAVSPVIGAAIGLVILAPTVVLFFPALGLEMGAAPALLATLALFTFLPVVDLLLPPTDGPKRRLRGALPALIAAVFAVAATGLGFAVDRFDAGHPIPVAMMYGLDADTGEAYWIRGGTDVTGWSDALVNGQQDLSARFPFTSPEATVGEATPTTLKAPTVRILTEKASAAGREVEVRITPRDDSRWVWVRLEGDVVAGASAGGRAIDAPDDGQLSLLFYSVPAEGLDLTLELKGAEPVTARVADATAGLDEIPGFVPRPEGVSIANSRTADMVVVVAEQTF